MPLRAASELAAGALAERRRRVPPGVSEDLLTAAARHDVRSGGRCPRAGSRDGGVRVSAQRSPRAPSLIAAAQRSPAPRRRKQAERAYGGGDRSWTRGTRRCDGFRRGPWPCVLKPRRRRPRSTRGSKSGARGARVTRLVLRFAAGRLFIVRSFSARHTPHATRADQDSSAVATAPLRRRKRRPLLRRPSPAVPCRRAATGEQLVSVPLFFLARRSRTRSSRRQTQVDARYHLEPQPSYRPFELGVRRRPRVAAEQYTTMSGAPPPSCSPAEDSLTRPRRRSGPRRA